jgi:isoleucyl-tRNA synthetase
MFYQNMKKGIPEKSHYYAESIHFLTIPEFNAKLIDEEIEKRVRQMQGVIILGRLVRDKKNLPVKQPLSLLSVITKDTKMLQSVKELEKYVTEELNILSVEYKENQGDYAKFNVSPNFKVIGERLGKQVIKPLKPAIEKMTPEQIKEYVTNKQITLEGHTLLEGEIVIEPVFLEKYSNDKDFGCASNLDGCIMLSIKITEELNKIRIARELASHIQKARKEGGVNIEDAVEIYYAAEGADIKAIIEANKLVIRQVVKVPLIELKYMPKHAIVLFKDQYEATVGTNGPQRISYLICQSHLVLDNEALAKKYKLKPAVFHKILKNMLAMPYSDAKKALESGSITITADGVTVVLEKGKEVYPTIEEYLAAKKA